MYIKFFIIRLHMLMLSPIFPSLLTLILLIIYKVHFEPVILCDSGLSPLLLDQLKENYEEQNKITTLISTNITNFMRSLQEKIETEGELTPTQIKYNNTLFKG